MVLTAALAYALVRMARSGAVLVVVLGLVSAGLGPVIAAGRPGGQDSTRLAEAADASASVDRPAVMVASLDPPDPQRARAGRSTRGDASTIDRWRRADDDAPMTSVVSAIPPRPAAPLAGALGQSIVPEQSAVVASAVEAPVRPAPPPAPAARALSAAVPAAVRRWEQLILAEARRHDLDPHLLAALMSVESAGDPAARSSAGAIGLMQVVGGPEDPVANVAAGAAILADHIRRFNRVDLALAAYNAGPNAVATFGGIPPYTETRWHVYLTLSRYHAFASE